MPMATPWHFRPPYNRQTHKSVAVGLECKGSGLDLVNRDWFLSHETADDAEPFLQARAIDITGEVFCPVCGRDMRYKLPNRGPTAPDEK